ncbi:MAG: hypothetical protein LH473_09480 [Chitinophagales bacterium]|nr:hypothetical protein [Chitinophagales bacterium]
MAFSFHPKLFYSIPNLLFISCLFIGVIAGMYIHDTVAGILVGSGFGFVLLAIARFILGTKKRKHEEQQNETPVQ